MDGVRKKPPPSHSRGEGSPKPEKETKQIVLDDAARKEKFNIFSGNLVKSGPESLTGRRILVTAGPTWVYIDAVRHLGNLSSGRTGLEIARAMAGAGASVSLLLGPGQVQPTPEDRRQLEVIPFVTFDDLHRLVRERVGSHRYHALVHAAAVSDYRPVEEQPGKLPSGEEELILRLRRTPKIVDEVKALDPGIFLIKFKLEVGRTEAELLAIARESGERSRADLVVANDLTGIGEGRHRAYIVDAAGAASSCETTAELSAALVRELAARLATVGKEQG